MTGADFVRQVMERLGVDSPAKLAEQMRWKRGVERTVARWLDGSSEPSFAYVMDMVERAELFSSPAPLGDRQEPTDPLESLAANDDEILANQEDALTAQQEMRDELRAIRATLDILAADARNRPTQSGASR